MSSKRPILLPTNTRLLKNLGENLALARRRRKISSEQMAERAGISRSTLWLVEKGDPGVAIGTFLQVLFVLGLEKDLNKLSTDDELGRKLQDAKLIPVSRSKKNSGTVTKSPGQGSVTKSVTVKPGTPVKSSGTKVKTAVSKPATGKTSPAMKKQK